MGAGDSVVDQRLDPDAGRRRVGYHADRTRDGQRMVATGDQRLVRRVTDNPPSTVGRQPGQLGLQRRQRPVAARLDADPSATSGRAPRSVVSWARLVGHAAICSASTVEVPDSAERARNCAT